MDSNSVVLGGAIVSIVSSFLLRKKNMDWLDVPAEVCAKDITAVDDYFKAVLEYADFDEWLKILGTLETDSENPFLLVLAADSLLTVEKYGEAIGYVKKASKLVSEANFERTRLYVAAFNAWLVEGSAQAAYEFFCDAVRKHPQDLFAAKRAQLMCILSGNDKGCYESIKLIKGLGHHSYYHGMLAFGLEQNKRFKQAEEVVRNGLKEGFDDPWLHHGFAHSLFFQGKHTNKEVKEFLQSKQDRWKGCCAFMKCHNFWHYALLCLEDGDYDLVKKVYVEQLWNDGLEVSMETILGAVGLLWRMDILDVDASWVNEKLQNVAQRALEKEWSPVNYFLFDITYLRALAALSDKQHFTNYIKKVKDFIEKSQRKESLRAIEILLDLLVLVYVLPVDYGTEDIKEKCSELEGVIENFCFIGGSREQRLVFEEFYLFILKKYGMSDQKQIDRIASIRPN